MSMCRVNHKDAIADFAHKSIPDSSTLVRPLPEDDVKYTRKEALHNLACNRRVVIGTGTTARDIRDVLLRTPVDKSAARTKEMNHVAYKLMRVGSPPGDVSDALLNMRRQDNMNSTDHRVRDIHFSFSKRGTNPHVNIV